MSLHLNQQQAMVERGVESTESIHFFEEKEREDQAMVFPRLLKQMEGEFRKSPFIEATWLRYMLGLYQVGVCALTKLSQVTYDNVVICPVKDQALPTQRVNFVQSILNRGINLMLAIVSDNGIATLNHHRNDFELSHGFYIQGLERLLDWMLVNGSQQSMLYLCRLTQLLAFCWMKQSKWEQAKSLLDLIYNQIPENDPTVHEALHDIKLRLKCMSGIVSIHLGHYSSAVQTLRFVDQSRNESSLFNIVEFWLGSALMLTKENDLALSVFKVALQKHYKITSTFLMLAKLLFETDQKTSVEFIKRAAESAENGDRYVDYNLAKIQVLNEGHQERSCQLLERAAQQESDCEAYASLGPAKDLNAIAATEVGSAAHGTPSISIAISSFPALQRHLILKDLLETCLQMNDWQGANHSFEALLKIQPDQPLHTMRDYVFVQLQIRDFEKALRTCDELLNCFTNDIQLLLYKADAFLSLEKVSDCLTVLEQLYTMDQQRNIVFSLEEQEQVYNNLAICLVLYGNPQRARRTIEMGLSADRIHVNLQLSMNYCLMLWQCNEKLLACTHWMDARGYDMDASRDSAYYEQLLAQQEIDFRIAKDHYYIASHVHPYQTKKPLNGATTKPIAFCSNSSSSSSSINNSSSSSSSNSSNSSSSNLDTMQVQYLDRLVLKYWVELRRDEDLCRSLKVMQHLFGTNTHSH